MKGLTLRLPDGEEQKLVYEAKRRGISKSSLVREALAAYLVRDPSSEERSAREAFKEVIGVFDGPKDLATNPMHMEGFGRK
jgi:predicted DNA-binding protein